MRKRRIPLSPGYHAEPGETRYHLHDVYTTIQPLGGNKRIHVGTLMKCAVNAWREAAKASGSLSLSDGESPVTDLAGASLVTDHVQESISVHRRWKWKL